MNDRFFPTGKPRAVDGGLKARSERGAIAKSWWSGRFIAVLETMGLGGRLQRGRRYARTGQVIDMDVAAGLVTARVQGSRPEPYRVRISITAYDKAQWARVERALAEKAWYAAQLLSGTMPDDLEEVFAEAGLPLFPGTGKDLSMDCSCPDWGVPCKHLAAVCYLLAESFDEDPFRILAWRGREREDLLANLRALRSPSPAGKADRSHTRVARAGRLPGCLFRAGSADSGLSARELPPDAILRQLPPLSLEVRGIALRRPAPARLSADGAGRRTGAELVYRSEGSLTIRSRRAHDQRDQLTNGCAMRERHAADRHRHRNVQRDGTAHRGRACRRGGHRRRHAARTVPRRCAARRAASRRRRLDIRPLDVTDHAPRPSCVDEVLATYGQIDILINNAGRGSVASLEQLSMDDLRAQLEVNYLGVAALTKLVLAPMRLAGSGRIVTVTSVGGVVGQPFADAYCAAKFAVEGLMQSLAPVVAQFGIGGQRGRTRRGGQRFRGQRRRRADAAR